MIYTSEYIFGTQRYTQRFRVGQNGIPEVIAVGSNGQSFIDFQVPGTEGIYRVNIEETGIDDYFDRYALTKADGLKGSRRFSDCFEGLIYYD